MPPDPNNSLICSVFLALAAAGPRQCECLEPPVTVSVTVLQAGSWQVAIVTGGRKAYYIGTYGLETSYNRLTCGPKFVSNFFQSSAFVSAVLPNLAMQARSQVWIWVVLFWAKVDFFANFLVEG